MRLADHAGLSVDLVHHSIRSTIVKGLAGRGGQLRKGTAVPYVAHLLGVASLVLEDGGDEDEVSGALLHEAAEDQGGEDRLADIRARFGERVARIVEGWATRW